MANEDCARDELGESRGSLGVVADDVWNNQPDATPDDVLELFLEWAEAQGFELWPHQEDALLSLMVGNHVILGTPTGSGKSMVALGLLFRALCIGPGSAYYTAPIKALVSEKFFDLVEILGRDNVGMITGDVSINPDAPVVCCTAEILANRALSEGPDANIGFVAMDEFHYYDDADRGWAWQVPLLALPKTQFLLMSATLGDMSAIADKLEEITGRTVERILDAPRPVPLEFSYVDTALEGTVELALRREEGPVYVVHFSQDAAVASAQALASYGVATKEQRDAIKAASKGTSFSTAFGKILQRLLGCGVAVHHAGMLPRYRLLVEKLAQQGLLPVICGTDTLGVGINVPIHTVLLTALVKYDGHRMRRLNAREFHQIAGRAGRSGFDTQGCVLVQAPEHEIENAKLRAKAGNDPAKQRKIKLKRPRDGQVTWNVNTYEKLVGAAPETLRPRLKITHSMVLNIVEQGGDARARTAALIDSSLQSPEDKARLHVRAEELFITLETAGVVRHDWLDSEGNVVANGDDEANAPSLAEGAARGWTPDYYVTVDLPEDFVLDQPLSPFMLAALELLDPESDDYELDVISMAEATVEDPGRVLRAQEKRAKDRAMAEMKADGIGFEERLEKLEEVTYPKPLEDELERAFALYCESVPWAAEHELRPKSVVREMVEGGHTFKSYIAAYNLARSEGTLLRYLSDAYRVLDRTIPLDKRTERLDDITSWLGVVVRSVDSSLVDEWAGTGVDGGEGAEAAAPAEVVVADRRGLTVLVRNALWKRVLLAAKRDCEALGELDGEWGYGIAKWRDALGSFFEEFEEIETSADAHNATYFIVDYEREQAEHRWDVIQLFRDPDDSRDFRIVAQVDLDATQDGGEVVFASYFVGFQADAPEKE